MPDPIFDESNSLAGRILAGDESAYLDFQATYRRLFLSFFLSLRIPAHEAEDLTVTVITDVLCDKIKTWKPGLGDFHAWVQRVARNFGLQWLRDQKKIRTIAIDPQLDLPARPNEAPNPDREAAVHDALAKLSVSDRVVIESREFDQDTPYARVAETLTRLAGRTVTEGAARVRHKRALERLGELLREDPRIKLRHLPTLQGGIHE